MINQAKNGQYFWRLEQILMIEKRQSDKVYNQMFEQVGDRYQKFRIPPDFDLAELHGRCCKVYSPNGEPRNRCGCCNQSEGNNPVSLCSYVSSLRYIGEEVPIFFKFINVMVFLVLLIIFFQAGIYLFQCRQEPGEQGTKCKLIEYTLKQNQIDDFEVNIWMGYIYSNETVFMIEIITYSVFILFVKIYLKKKKYDYRSFAFDIEKRSVQLINLPKKAKREHIQKLFQGYQIEEIVFAYRIQRYFKLMCKISKMIKTIKYLSSQNQNSVSHNQKIKVMLQRYSQKIQQLKKQKNDLHHKQNRLSTAFVVFQTKNQQQKTLATFHQSLPAKLFFKLCTCFSPSKILRQHVTVIAAPSPEDVNWVNLQNPYWRTKMVRFASFFACITILLFGITSQVIFFRDNNQVGKLLGDIFASGMILLLNFLIINFLQWTTFNVQKRQTNTMMKKSLMRKLTFFMFINVSISPFLIYIYERLVNGQHGIKPLDLMSLTILLVATGNCFKPFLSVFSIPRFVSWIKCVLEKRKGQKSELNQLQANKMFEPMDFPIQIFYSLVLTSMMMAFFYLGCFQILIVIQLPALLIVYFVAKWMLLKVCKKPQGLTIQLNNLAQSLLRFFVPLYWAGRNTINYLTLQQSDSKSSLKIYEWIFQQKPQAIISASFAILMLLCEYFVRVISKIISSKYPGELSEYLMEKQPGRTYSQANTYLQLYEQDPIEWKGIFKEQNKVSYGE